MIEFFGSRSNDRRKKCSASVDALRMQREVLKGKAKNIAEAIAAMGHSPTFLAQLSLWKRRSSRLSAANKPQQFASNIEELRGFVARKAMDLTTVLRSDVTAARRALANHIQKLVLTPKESPDGDVLEVSGDVDLFGGDDRVMQVVARDGLVQHYTPFLRDENAISTKRRLSPKIRS